MRILVTLISFMFSVGAMPGQQHAADRDYPYFEIEGTASAFEFNRNWRAYYWREDFTMVVRDDDGKEWRIISREPTPWNNLRMGTTYTGLKVDWKKRPRVKVIGVQAIDRVPVEYYGLKLDPKDTATAFILRVKSDDKAKWRDYYINNWFHRWGPDTDVKMLGHYAADDPNYTVYGYLNGIAAPFDKFGKVMITQSSLSHSGLIHHSRVVKAKNDIGYELRLIHLVGRNKKTARYEAVHGDLKKLVPLDRTAQMNVTP